MRLDAKRILVPVNGKPYSERSFRWACQIAREAKTELHAVYVIEVPLALYLESEISDDINKGEEILAQRKQFVSNWSNNCKKIVMFVNKNYQLYQV